MRLCSESRFEIFMLMGDLEGHGRPVESWGFLVLLSHTDPEEIRKSQLRLPQCIIAE